MDVRFFENEIGFSGAHVLISVQLILPELCVKRIKRFFLTFFSASLDTISHRRQFRNVFLQKKDIILLKLYMYNV